MRREIIYDKSFDRAVDALGGYRAIDRALDTVVEALSRNPYAFNKFESDIVSFRYAITSPVRDLPSLVIVFRIEPGNVTLEHVEENSNY
jgi:hypothetical protein